jgi:hypothetical protein
MRPGSDQADFAFFCEQISRGRHRRIPVRVPAVLRMRQLERKYCKSLRLFFTRPIHALYFCNWLAGSLSGPKSPIFRHTSQFFLTIALLLPTKNRFV